MVQNASTYFTYKTPVGHLTIASDGTAITHLALGARPCKGMHKPTALTNEASNQIQEYLAGKRTSFDLPLAPAGSAFQKQVWEALCAIPYGETRSYRAIAEAVDKPQACRAVGNANNKNPIPIIIPCHRVVSSSGGLGGYAYGLKMKSFLLDLEKDNT